MLVTSALHNVCFADMPTAKQANRPNKVRGTDLPQEYELARFTADIVNPHPSWITSIPACEWHAVLCNEKRDVITINWDSMGLAGSLRWDSICRTLSALSVDYYPSSGQHPNRLTGKVTFDHFPSQVTFLGLSHNLFSGELHLEYLPQLLRDFYSTENQFEGKVDLCHLPSSLVELFIDRNNLSGNIDLGSLPRIIEYLNFSHNKFTGILDLRHLPSTIQFLSCNDNFFVGTLLLDCLPNALQDLDVHNNSELCGTVKMSVFNSCPSFTQVHVTGTKICLRYL